MKEKLTVKTTVSINAPAEKVWKAITTPSLIKKYLMGTTVTSSWKEGSTIEYEGEYNGKKYHDKGVIKKIEKGRLLQSTYWSSAGGKGDNPENYNLVTYKLDEKEGQEKTIVTLTQDNVLSEQEKEHVTGNWKTVLKKLKKVAEN